ncbi:hypothetical protein CKM354_001061200 [Cercospora kikuchii]|uniref:Uncharacterized protein n=1 Tax=Cercospora kikuchii TaxID=84275 RepID=A0A9P3FHA1_9PEZI|nr:uncharacterized protein CKM354_001061200 [Cercospora kikuchii]GIZ47523.1 hypothetical protein CKM354_001061200 [Cercospora kikuchii]
MATSAASRVFGIAELLDMILLEYAALEQHLNPFRPVTKLFVFQRVNHMFQEAIMGSEVLRRAMFLEHADEEEMRAIELADKAAERDGNHDLAAIFWLMNIPCSSSHCIGVAGPRPLKNYGPRHVLLYEPKILTRGILYPSATWRQMKAQRSTGERNHYELCIYWWDRLGGYCIEDGFVDQEELWEVSSFVFWLLERSQAEHRALSSLSQYEGGFHTTFGSHAAFLAGDYTEDQARDLLAFLDDIQKDVGGGKGGKALEGKAKGSKKKGPSKKRHGRKSGKKQN